MVSWLLIITLRGDFFFCPSVWHRPCIKYTCSNPWKCLYSVRIGSHYSLHIVPSFESLMNTFKLRVIQSKSNGFVSQLGDLCYSGIKSFTDTNPREPRPTLMITNNEDGTTDASVFESVWSGEKNNEGQHIFVTVTTPVTVRNVNTKVHLMSSLSDKMELVNSIIWVTHRGVYITPPHSQRSHYNHHHEPHWKTTNHSRTPQQTHHR